MIREELRDYVDEQRALNNIPYHVYSTLIDGIDTLEQGPKWIPVSERLPDETKTKGHGLCHVLVTHTYAGITRTHQAVFTQGKFLKLENYKEDNTVVAWMPLPEPYKAER